jgi:hypothetical protein
LTILFTSPSPEYWLPALLAGLSFGWAVMATMRRQFTRRDLVALFLGLVVLPTLAELGSGLTLNLAQTATCLSSAIPPSCLAADGLARLFQPLAVKWTTGPTEDR